MRRVLGVLLVAVVAVLAVAPAAAAFSPEHPRPAAAQAEHTGRHLGRPADIDVGSCAQAAFPIWGVISGATAECAGGAVEAGVGEISEEAAEAFSDFFDPFVREFKRFVSSLIVSGFTWWLTTDSPRLSSMGVLGGNNDGLSLETICLFIGTMIATLLTIFQGLRTIFRRKGTPLLEAAQGLMWHVIAVGIGVAVIDSLLVASDGLTKAILAAGFDSADEAPEQINALLLPQVANPVSLLVMAGVVLLVGFIQLVLLFLRQAALPVFALILPIASSGQVGEGTPRQWLPRLTVAILTIVCYKPFAALIITLGFVEMGEADNLAGWFRGVVTLALSVAALPMMMKLFAPLGLAAGNASTAGAGLAAAAVSAATLARGGGEAAAAGGGAGGTSAAQHANYMNQAGPSGDPPGGNGAPEAGDAGGRQGSSAVQQANAGNDGQVPEQSRTEGGQTSGPPAGTSSPEGGAAAPAAAPAGSGTGAGSPAPAGSGGSLNLTVMGAEVVHGTAAKGAATVSEGARES